MGRLLGTLGLCLVLSGCVADQQSRQNVALPQAVPPVVPELTRSDLDGAVHQLRTEAQASNNAMQNSLTGIGANVGKVAEKIDASLAHIDAQFQSVVNAQANVSAQASANVTATVKNEAKASAEVTTRAVADLEARVNARLDAIAQAQAQGQIGLNNRLESMQQTVSAGRDAINTTVQYSRDMAETQQRSYESNERIVWILGGVIVALQELSRRRAERRWHVATGQRSGQNEGGATCPGFLRRMWRAFF